MKKLNKVQRTKTTKMFKDAFSPTLSHINKTLVNLPIQREPIYAFDTTPPSNAYPIYFTDSIAFTSFSTYPFRDGKKIGNPICDKGKGIIYSDMSIICLADGCGVGRNVYKAADIAANTAVQTVVSKIWDCKTIKDIAELMVNAAISSHFAIIDKDPNALQIGTTTFMLTISVYDVHNYPIVLSLSIGDCHSYRYLSESSKVTHVNGTPRCCQSDMSDCGGRIGPFIEKKFPDLRNAEIFVVQCEEGDGIILTTDGYHDNFDPENLDMNPVDIGIDSKDWEHAFQNEYYNDKKVGWINRFLTNIVKSSYTSGHLVEQLSEYIINTTAPTRIFTQKNPQSQLPKDPHNYPGKCDHSTIITLKLTRRREYYTYIDSIHPRYSSSLLGNGSVEVSRLPQGSPLKPYTHFPLGQRNRFDTRKQDLSDPSSLYYTMRTSPQSMSPVAFSKDHTTQLEPPSLPRKFGYPISFRSAHTDIKLSSSESCYEQQELE
ncbi:PPM-type phosphatase domain-containing protein [Entamoeba marina]